MSESTALQRYRPLVDDWPAFTEACARPLPTCIWTNTTRIAPPELSDLLTEEGVDHAAIPWMPEAFLLRDGVNPGTTIAYLAGLCHVQEEVSLLPVFALSPTPGDRVLDLCAAPGNKTVHAAAAVGFDGSVLANDRSGARLNVLRTALARLGLPNVATCTLDAAAFPLTDPAFDCVIADVPCSCEGTSRKHPDVLNRASVAQSTWLAHRQQSILERAVANCRPGGRVVYSTCTYAPEENELVVEAVLQANENLRMIAVDAPGLTRSDGLVEWKGNALHPDLRHALRVWPHQNDTGGFFVAVLEKSLP